MKLLCKIKNAQDESQFIGAYLKANGKFTTFSAWATDFKNEKEVHEALAKVTETIYNTMEI